MAEWDEFKPRKRFVAQPGTDTALEDSAVRRLLVKTGLNGAACDTFDELVDNLGFPFRLTAVKLTAYAQGELLIDMAKRPAKSSLMMQYDDVCEKLADDQREQAGVVFNWVGFGGLHVFTSTKTFPMLPGDNGYWWHISGRYFILQHLASFAVRVGPAADW